MLFFKRRGSCEPRFKCLFYFRRNSNRRLIDRLQWCLNMLKCCDVKVKGKECNPEDNKNVNI